MKYVLILSLVLINFNYLLSNETNVEDNSFITVSLAQDPAFGFYPIINGGIPLNENLNFTFYGIFWTQDALAGNQGGIGLLTEFGIGLNLSILDGSLNLNPNLGVGNGKFQSGGSRPVVGDNIVPSVYVGLNLNKINSILGFIYWKGLRKEVLVDKYRDQIQYFLNFWYEIHKNINVGFYYDHFLLKEEDSSTSNTNTAYHWIGPSIKFKPKSNAELWFAFGADIYEYTNSIDNASIKDFYKLVFSITF